MPLDYRAFAPYQHEMSSLCRSECKYDDNDTKQCFIFNNLIGVWEQDKYVNLCSNTIMNYGQTMQEIINRDGSIKGMK